MNKRADFLISECYVDTNLVETLLNAGCNHQKGCNQVAKVMQDKFADNFAVGIIDADKRKPGYLSQFNEIASSAHVKLYAHISRKHYIIVISPAIDSFILSCAKNASIDISGYELSPILKEFTTQTKNVMSNKDKRFKQLFKVMENVGEFKLMKSLLSYFTTVKYSATENEIVAIFNEFK